MSDIGSWDGTERDETVREKGLAVLLVVSFYALYSEDLSSIPVGIIFSVCG